MLLPQGMVGIDMPSDRHVSSLEGRASPARPLPDGTLLDRSGDMASNGSSKWELLDSCVTHYFCPVTCGI